MFSVLEPTLYKNFPSPYEITIRNNSMIGSRTVMGLPEIIPDVIPEERDPSGQPLSPDGYYDEEYDEEYSSSVLLFL